MTAGGLLLLPDIHAACCWRLQVSTSAYNHTVYIFPRGAGSQTTDRICGLGQGFVNCRCASSSPMPALLAHHRPNPWKLANVLVGFGRGHGTTRRSCFLPRSVPNTQCWVWVRADGYASLDNYLHEMGHNFGGPRRNSGARLSPFSTTLLLSCNESPPPLEVAADWGPAAALLPCCRPAALVGAERHGSTGGVQGPELRHGLLQTGAQVGGLLA